MGCGTTPPKKKKRKKGTLKGLSFDEVSFVGQGANQNANVSIIKMEGDPEEIAKAMFIEFLADFQMDSEKERFIQDVYDHNSALRRSVANILWSDTENKQQAMLENLQAFVQSFASMVTDSDVIKSMTDLDAILKGEEPQPKPEVKDVKKGMNYFMAMALLTDIQKSVFNSLDEGAQGALLTSVTKAEEGKEVEIDGDLLVKSLVVEPEKKPVVKGADDTFEMDGNVISKADVGDASFLLMKGMAARIEQGDKDTAAAQSLAKEEQDKRILKELSDEAETRWPNLPGSAVEKGETLKAIRDMPEAVQKTQLAMLDSGNSANKNLFKEHGVTNVEGGSPVEKLNALAKTHAETNSVSFAKGYDAVLQTDEGKELYNQSLGH